MNAVEIEEAISDLATQPFDPEIFPWALLEALGNKKTTIERLKKGSTNNSDVEGGILQRSNIHLKICNPNEDVEQVLEALRESKATKKGKVKILLATDGKHFEAMSLLSGEYASCEYKDFPNHFGIFLPLAGIVPVKEIENNPIDIKATGRLNKLYVELLKTNEEWASDERRHEMNQFMARLIFCFFAEDTDIFGEDDLFTKTIEQMTDGQSGNTQNVLAELFRAMDTKPEDRSEAKLTRWADKFPYVNGGLFSGNKEIPKFTRIARSYLLNAGRLNWKKINPDIFGSMIQAIAEDDERGELGMHYTSVPNILKVLNPLFLDDLREQLKEAGDNTRKLLNLRKRISNIRVFDPACGSGNFLVIAYIQMREIEAEIIKRRQEADQRTWIKLENFFGIEIKDFAVEVARLSLLIAEFQCDVRLVGQIEAKQWLLPLKKTGHIQQGNALQLDWRDVCHTSDESVETFICGNPPYRGSQWQTLSQKADLQFAFNSRTKTVGSLDYVTGWFIKARDYIDIANCRVAFVATNSINQGRQVPNLWPLLIKNEVVIIFARPSFKWSNLAKNEAGVTVSIIGFGRNNKKSRLLFLGDNQQIVENISPYLVSGSNLVVKPTTKPLSNLHEMSFGSMPNDGGFLLLDKSEAAFAVNEKQVKNKYIRRFYGSQEFINGTIRYCIWITKDEYERGISNDWLIEKFVNVQRKRNNSDRATTKSLSEIPYSFGEVRQKGDETVIIIPRVSSENRNFLPVGYEGTGKIVGDRNFALYDAPLWNMALIASRLHWVWIGTVCVRLEMRFSYSNTLGWNTFPVPPLTESNKKDLTKCAKNILLAREEHFPATIAELYDPEKMPENLRQAHERNDETLERIYIGRRFKNDTERLEKLFEMYSKMTQKEDSKNKTPKEAQLL